jgi:heme-degrading monooxygenase HmoA
MIGRLWSGRTEPANADAYEAFLRDDLLPDVARLAGARGAYVLRRDTVDGAVEFVTLTLFESLEAVRGFAGDDPDRAVIEPRAQELLAEYDPEVRHFDVVVEPS